MYKIQKVEWDVYGVCEYTDIYNPQNSGTLPVTGPKCSLEIGEAGSLQFTLLPGHPLINSLPPVSTFVRLLDDDEEIFFGKVLQRSEPVVTGRVPFTCAGALSFLMDSEVPPFGKNSSGQPITQHWTAEAFFRWCIEKHNADVDDPRRQFTVGTVSASKKDTESDYQISSYTQTKSVIESNLINTYGGFLRAYRDESDVLYIDWIQEYETVDAQEIELGNNLIDQTNQVDGTSFFTVIRPVGDDGITLDEETIDLFDLSEMLEYGRIVKTIQFSGAANKQQLAAKANEYKENIQKMLFVDCDVRFIDMHYIDGTSPKIRLGNRFTDIHGMGGAEMVAASLELNLDAPQNNSAGLKNRRSLENDLTPDGNAHKGKSLSRSGARSAGQYFRYLKETGDTLEVTAKTVSMQGETLAQHYETITTTANEVVTLSRRADSVDNTLAPITESWAGVQATVQTVEGSQVLQNDNFIATTVGKFEVATLPDGRTVVRLKDGADLQVSDQSGIMQTVGEMIGRHEADIDGVQNTVDLIEGSALWTQRDGITGVAGEFEVAIDPVTGERTLIVKSGGGLKIRRNLAEYGLYDEGNLTGGLLVERLNDGTTATSIRGDVVDISTNSDYASILVTTTNIASEVRRKARVYVQINDPHLDTAITLYEGDIWIKSIRMNTWNDMGSKTWSSSSDFNWNQYAGSPQYVWTGTRWEMLGDQGAIVEYGTRIDQTERSISLIAQAIGAIDPTAIASIDISADAIQLAVSTAKSELYSVIRQTATNITHEVTNNIEGMSSYIEQTASQIRSEVSAAKSSLYSSITQTATNIISQVDSDISNISSYVEQTTSSMTQAIARKNKVFVMMTDPTLVPSNNVIDGDIWIKAVANDKIKPTWNDLNAKSWSSQSSTNWREYYDGHWYVRKNNAWSEMRSDADVVEIGTKLEQDEKHIALIARDVDANHQELGARLEVTATQIRGEVHAAKSNLYSVVMQTATNVFSGVYNRVEDNFSTIEQTANSISTQVNAAKSTLYSAITQTATYIRTQVANAKSEMSSSIVQTASQIRSEVNSAKSSLYSAIIQTSTNIINEVNDDLDGISSYVEQTKSSLNQAIARKNKVFVQMTDPASGNTVIDGDIWIKSSGNNNIKPTWSELSAKSWTSQSSTNWREYYEGYWYVRKSGSWERMNADADATEIGTMLEQDEKHIALIARDVDANHQELGARLEVTATQIRGEVHAAKSNLYSVVMQTATNVFSGVYNRVEDNFSTIEQTASSIKTQVNAAKSTLYSTIMQTATSVFSGVYDQVGDNFSTIEQTASLLSLKVGKGEVISSINQTAETITIQASKINLDGYVSTSTLSTALANLASAHINKLYVDTNIYAPNGNSIYALGLQSVALTRSGNTYTLKQTTLNGTESTIGTFSRAVTSWDMGWSSGKLTITAQPQNQSCWATVYGGSMSRSGRSVTIPIKSVTSNSDPNEVTVGNATGTISLNKTEVALIREKQTQEPTDQDGTLSNITSNGWYTFTVTVLNVTKVYKIRINV